MIAKTTGMARVAMMNPRFLMVRMNSNPTTVPRLCCLNAVRAIVLDLCHFVLFPVHLDEDFLERRPCGGEAANRDAGPDEFAQYCRFVGAGLGGKFGVPG